MSFQPLGDYSVMLSELASRPCGTNTYDASARLGLTRDHASDQLKTMARRGYLYVLKSDRGSMRLHQYFLHEEHAQAWTGDNGAFRKRVEPAKKKEKPARKLKAQTPLAKLNWRRAPMTGDPKQVATTKVVQCESEPDTRFRMSPTAAAEFVGEFQAEWKRLRGER